MTIQTQIVISNPVRQTKRQINNMKLQRISSGGTNSYR